MLIASDCWGKFLTPVVFVTKQYNLIPVKAWSWTGTACDSTARVRGLRLWCLAEGYRIGDKCRPVGLYDLRKTSALGRSRFRSVDLYQMYVPRTRTNYGDHSFSVNGPAVWNSLPVDLRAPDISIDIFKHQLKAFLFTTVYWLRICGLGEYSVLQMSLLLLLLFCYAAD